MTCARVALVGAGRMGENHARVIAGSVRSGLALVVDTDADRARRVAQRWGTEWSTDLHAASDMDAVVVSSSTPSHFDLANALIGGGTPLLVEKPLTLDIEQARDLVRDADAKDVVLMCGFVERFNASFARLARHADLHRSRHIEMVRIGRSPHEMVSGVVHDVLLHDIDLLIRLLPADVVTEVRAQGSDWSPLQARHESVRCEVAFASGATASLHASRISATRERSITITTDDGSIEHADLLADPGDPLVAQWRQFMGLVDRVSPEREAERRTLLPSHEIADHIQHLLTATAPPAEEASPGPAAVR
ncbi:MAG: Gfo/Idh/MocA family oxidoreductase [Ilumatobacteraceae bacterium]|nr:Gfo/Idh/MocA family oxidoreductase [Ilumatobacteraceae bacterium]